MNSDTRKTYAPMAPPRTLFDAQAGRLIDVKPAPTKEK